MSKKIEFVLELTRDEAIALVLLSCSGLDGDAPVEREIGKISSSLIRADRSLHSDQFALWEFIGEPTVELVRKAHAKK